MAVELIPLPDVIRLFDLAPKKSLGQHFLLDDNLLMKIVRGAGDISTSHIIEVGPGPGGLTRAILASGAKHLTAIEKDARCLAALAQVKEKYGDRFTLLEADALKVDITKIGIISSPPPPGGRTGGGHEDTQYVPLSPLPNPPLKGEGISRMVIANLPYNVGTALVIDWLHAAAKNGRKALTSFTVMLQKEVAERMVANVGDEQYGRLGVIMKQYTESTILFDVPAGAFSPPPKVTSAVLHARILDKPREDVELKLLERVVASAFNHRRKMLRQSLKAVSQDPIALCEKAGIDATLRAEQCDLAMFARLARAL